MDDLSILQSLPMYGIADAIGGKLTYEPDTRKLTVDATQNLSFGKLHVAIIPRVADYELGDTARVLFKIKGNLLLLLESDGQRTTANLVNAAKLSARVEELAEARRVAKRPLIEMYGRAIKVRFELRGRKWVRID